MKVRELAPALALALILLITAAWWALALWPLPADTPAWLERTRFVCFGSTRDTLPTPAGWSLLIGEPLAMLAALWIIWPRALRASLAALRRSWPGRVALAGGTVAVLVGLAATGLRIRSARAAETFDPTAGTAAAIADLPRLDRPTPLLDLVDQHGRRTTMDRFRGRTVIVAFAYAHCATVCPLIVHDAIAAQAAVRAASPDRAPALVIVTLDPWRDVPARLSALAEAWGLGADAWLLSGEVAEVEAALDAWAVPRTRDGRTGEITHPTFVYLVDGRSRIVFQSPGRTDVMVRLLGRL